LGFHQQKNPFSIRSVQIGFAIAGRSGQRDAMQRAGPFALYQGTNLSRATGTHHPLKEGYGFSRAENDAEAVSPGKL
jgi:hypothetical protein